MNALSERQIEQFIEDGFLVLRDCFTPEAADPLVDEAWRLLGHDRDDRATWSKPLAFLFPETRVLLRDLSPALWAAICRLSGGEDRLASLDYDIGQWVINFTKGAGEPYIPPGPDTVGWHVDGVFFRHFLDSPEQGLLVVPLFSDIHPRGGGTVFAPDSVAVIARFLAAHPEGIGPGGFGFADRLAACHDFREITGQTGDVVIFHPFMMHSFSQNHRLEPRFITNICIGLKEPMRFNGPVEKRSPVEQAVLKGLGVGGLDFQIRHPRERLLIA